MSFEDVDTSEIEVDYDCGLEFPYAIFKYCTSMHKTGVVVADSIELAKEILKQKYNEDVGVWEYFKDTQFDKTFPHIIEVE